MLALQNAGGPGARQVSEAGRAQLTYPEGDLGEDTAEQSKRATQHEQFRPRE
jgi:hypothetical protein